MSAEKNLNSPDPYATCPEEHLFYAINFAHSRDQVGERLVRQYVLVVLSTGAREPIEDIRDYARKLGIPYGTPHGGEKAPEPVAD